MTTYLWDLFPVEDLNQNIDAGYVKVQQHPTVDLAIANYTPAAQYGNEWNDVTRACRGLIWRTDDDRRFEVVARPFPKFFNWDQMGAPKLPVGPVRIGPKMDGSLGVLYKTYGDANCPCHAYSIATRGSFTSDQAQRGTQMYRELCEDSGFEPWDERTYLFEIIYPENRIVVDYGNRSTLVLLDVIDNATGKSDLAAFDEALWFDKVEWRMVPEFDHRLIESIPDGEEGLVFYWHGNDVRVKMKAAEYVRLHRIVTNTSTRTVWEILSSGASVESLLESVPDEFYEWVRNTAAELENEYARIQAHCLRRTSEIHAEAMAQIGHGFHTHEFRKAFAAVAKKDEFSDVLFRMIDHRTYDDAIWKRLKPAYAKAFANQSEDVG